MRSRLRRFQILEVPERREEVELADALPALAEALEEWAAAIASGLVEAARLEHGARKGRRRVVSRHETRPRIPG